VFSIRRASEADVDILLPLKVSAHALHVAERPDFFRHMKQNEVNAWLREGLAETSTHVWVAEDGGKPIGYVLATQRERPETPFSVARKWCEIAEIIVEVDHRRRGVARALMARAIAHAHALGLDAIELSTWAFNEHAHAAFVRMGFQRMLVRYELAGSS
jgi:ribosomal protein S18 acetylase RimI-like enzyme